MLKKLLVAFFFFAATQAYAWNFAGHEIVAQIAYSHLTPQARQQVDNLVKIFAKEYPHIHSFMEMAPWADSLRGQDVEIYTHWHYVDQAYSTDHTPLKNLSDTDNVVYAINRIEPVIGNSKANDYERARFLAFLVHIVGDVHQPLHAVSRISAAHPDGDQGGNLFYVYTNEGADETKLHSVWDKGCNLLLVTNEYAVKMLSEKIESDYPQRYFGNQVNDLVAQDWADESFHLAKSFAYNTPEDQVLSHQYILQGQQYSEQRLALAGYRLANLLNQLFS